MPDGMQTPRPLFSPNETPQREAATTTTHGTFQNLVRTTQLSSTPVVGRAASYAAFRKVRHDLEGRSDVKVLNVVTSVHDHNRLGIEFAGIVRPEQIEEITGVPLDKFKIAARENADKTMSTRISVTLADYNAGIAKLKREKAANPDEFDWRQYLNVPLAEGSEKPWAEKTKQPSSETATSSPTR